MAKGRDEVETTVYSVIDDVSPIQAAFVSKKSFKLIINVLNNRSKTVGIVDSISIAWSIDNSQTKLYTSFFNFNG